jgi:secondary thiamine-phosphate synthase enzyme
MKHHFHVHTLDTGEGINLHNLTDVIHEQLQTSGVQDGFVIVSSRHTTMALTINEDEARLLQDINAFFSKLVPGNDAYLHNDIHLRDCPADEPENAHSHLIGMMLGSSEAIPVVAGQLQLGQWQSVMLVELDGPRSRQVNIQISG